MGSVVAKATEPALAAIKLAWWRERLEELDQGKAPAEPRLRAVAAELIPRGIGGADLAGLEAGWAALLDEQPGGEAAAERGTLLFRLGARLLGVEFRDETLGVAGRVFAWVDAARRGIGGLPRPISARLKIPGPARPLTTLAALAARDLRNGGPPFEPEATPGRAWTILKHRLTGRIG